MINLTSMLDYHARRTPNAEALVYERQRISFAELHARATSAAGWLAEEGVRPGKIVALLMKNSPAFLDLVFALSHLGAVALPLNFRLAAQEVDFIVGHAGASLLVVDEALAGRVAGLAIERRVLSEAARRDIRCMTIGQGGVPRAAPVTLETLFRLMYTSGTTDRPKGVMHTYGNLAWKNLDHIVALGLTSADRLLVAGPLYHVGAFDLPGIAVLMAGGTLVLLEDFEPGAVLEAIARERVTGAWLAPVMINAILAAPAASSADVASPRGASLAASARRNPVSARSSRASPPPASSTPTA